MPYVLLQQVSSEFAKSNAGRTLDHPVALKYFKDFIDPEVFLELMEIFENGNAYIWGAKPERYHQMEKMVPLQTLVLFRRNKRVFKIGLIEKLLISIKLAERLWGCDVDGETWAIIYLMNNVRGVSFDAEILNEIIGRKKNDNWQGMTSIEGEPAERVVSYVKQKLHLS